LYKGIEMGLKLFHIYDGEDWWIAHLSAEEVLAYAWQIDVDEEKTLKADDVETVDGGISFRVFLPDFHPSDLDADEYPKKPCKDEKDRWFCCATVDEWLATCEPGSLVASSIY